MFSFVRDSVETVSHGAAPTLFMAFFVYVWLLWAAKALAARRYRPGPAPAPPLADLRDRPGLQRARGDLPARARERRREPPDRADRGGRRRRRRRSPRSPPSTATACCGCRSRASAPRSPPGCARATPRRTSSSCSTPTRSGRPMRCTEMLRPFADPRVGGVTPRQAVFDPGDNPVRRLADWIEDIRYHLTVPAQSVFGQVGCLAGRTIAYRRTAFEPAVARLVRQTVLGVPQHVGDDRVLTSELLRGGWRTVYQSTAAGGDRRAVGLADVLAPAAALGPLEPAGDAARPALAVAPPGGVRVLRRRHPHAVRALRRDRARRRARVPRSAAPPGCRSRSSSRSATSGCWRASACGRPPSAARPARHRAAAPVRPADHLRDGPDPHRRLRDDVPPGLEQPP